MNFLLSLCSFHFIKRAIARFNQILTVKMEINTPRKYPSLPFVLILLQISPPVGNN